MKEKELKSKGKLLKPIINVGKNGLTDSLVLHIIKTLKKKKLIKIKFTRGALEGKNKKELLEKLLKKTGAKLVDFAGFNAVIHKTPSADEKIYKP